MTYMGNFSSDDLASQFGEDERRQFDDVVELDKYWVYYCRLMGYTETDPAEIERLLGEADDEAAL